MMNTFLFHISESLHFQLHYISDLEQKIPGLVLV